VPRICNAVDGPTVYRAKSRFGHKVSPPLQIDNLQRRNDHSYTQARTRAWCSWCHVRRECSSWFSGVARSANRRRPLVSNLQLGRLNWR
jgi:hypothetical protein